MTFDECLEEIEHIGGCEFCDSNIDLSIYDPYYYAYTYFQWKIILKNYMSIHPKIQWGDVGMLH